MNNWAAPILWANLTIEAAERPIGKWGRMHKAYLEEVHPIQYLQLILNGTLNKHLADVNERVSEVLDRLVKQMAQQECVTERLIAEQPMGWGGRMNNIRYRVKETIREESIDTL